MVWTRSEFRHKRHLDLGVVKSAQLPYHHQRSRQGSFCFPVLIALLLPAHPNSLIEWRIEEKKDNKEAVTKIIDIIQLCELSRSKEKPHYQKSGRSKQENKVYAWSWRETFRDSGSPGAWGVNIEGIWRDSDFSHLSFPLLFTHSLTQPKDKELSALAICVSRNTVCITGHLKHL